MKRKLRLYIPASLLVVLALAGCNLPGYGVGVQRATATPNLVFLPTASPMVVAATPMSSNATETPTVPEPSSTPLPPTSTAVPATAAPATATMTPTAASNTAIPATGGSLAGITLPASRTQISFPAGSSSYAVKASLTAGSPVAYTLRAAAGQRIYISVDGNAVFQVLDAGGAPITGMLSALNPVPVRLSQSANYTIALQGEGPVVMSLYIPPLNASQSIPAPLPASFQTLQFASGATSGGLSLNMTAGTPVGFRVTALAGQRMTVTTGVNTGGNAQATSGNATVTLLAPDGKTLVPSLPAVTHQWIFPLAQSGTYLMILLGDGPVTGTVSIPALSSPVEHPTPVPMPNPRTRVSFAAGNASAVVNTTLASGTAQAYVLGLQAGQTLYVETTGAVDVTIYDPAMTTLVAGHASSAYRWSAPAAKTGDYTFVVSGSGACRITFYVPPLP